MILVVACDNIARDRSDARIMVTSRLITRRGTDARKNKKDDSFLSVRRWHQADLHFQSRAFYRSEKKDLMAINITFQASEFFSYKTVVFVKF